MAATEEEGAASIENVENAENTEDELTIRKIFIGHVNSYQGKAIAKRLPDFKNHASSISGKLYEIYGSLQVSDEVDNEVVENYAPRILDRKKSSYWLSILECEIIVYDIGMHNSQVVEAQKVLEMLEAKLKACEPDSNEPVRYFILISTPMVWARTVVESDEGAAPLTEADYRKRRAHPCYLKHQYLEREVMNAQNRHKGRLRTIVICPGVTYGGRNDVLHYIFKKAFYNKESIEIYQKDRNELNYIPMIYINDFAQMISNVIESFPPEKIRYLLAVQPNPMSLKSFAIVVARTLAGNPMKVKICTKDEILNASENLISQRVYHYLTLNLKMVPTYFQDFPFTFSDDLEEMGNRLADEFRRERNLLPIKIIVDGPPCSGKTTLCRALAEQYEVHYIDPKSVVYNVIKSLEQKIEEAKSYLNQTRNFDAAEYMAEDAEGDLDLPAGAESVDFLRQPEMSVEIVKMTDSLREQLIEWEAELTDLTEYMQSIHEEDEMDFDYIKKCLVEILSSKPCSENQGYVIDDFPFDYNQASEIFPTSLFHPSEEEEEEDIPQNMYTYSMKPTFFIVLIAPDEILFKRAMSLTEKEAVETQNTEEQLIARLAKYRERTEEDVTCTYFFSDNDITPIIIKITADMKPEQVLEQVKRQIGAPHIYPMTRTQMDQIAKSELKAKMEKEQEERLRREQVERDEIAAREEKLQDWTEKFERLKRQEQDMLESKSLPLRSYLCKYVLPTLTEGLLKVAEVKPEDPIDYLAEYLFRCNPTGRVLDPAYSEEAKRLLLSLDWDAEQMIAKQGDEESRADSLECDDSFITHQIDAKSSYIAFKRKHKRTQKSEASKTSSSTDSVQGSMKQKSHASTKNETKSEMRKPM